MSRLIMAGVVILSGSIAWAVSAAQSPPLRTVMQEKVRDTQGLLRPLVLGDFAGIEAYATRLGRLTYTEVASWQANPNSEYQDRAYAFLNAIEELGQAAHARDLSRASAAYAGLVSSCVNCHQQLKGRQSVALSPDRAVQGTSAPERRGSSR